MRGVSVSITAVAVMLQGATTIYWRVTVLRERNVLTMTKRMNQQRKKRISREILKSGSFALIISIFIVDKYLQTACL